MKTVTLFFAAVLALVGLSACGGGSSSSSSSTSSSSSRASSASSVSSANAPTNTSPPVQNAAQGGPPAGNYVCYNYGSYFGQVAIPTIGTYTLNGGAPGAYTFDASTMLIDFTSGQFHDYGWGGHWYPHGSNPSLNSDTIAIDENDLKILCRPS